MLTLRKPYLRSLAALTAAAAVIALVGLHRFRQHSAVCAQDFDLIIAGAEIIDGSGSEAFVADVGVKEKRIACIGDLSGATSPQVINARGLTIAPGFIDVHTHVERNVAPGSPFVAPNFIRQGVTTIVTGNCGRSALDLGKFFRLLETHHSQVNVASFIGHNTIRQSVMGQTASAPSPKQLREMSALVKRAMNDGAFGMSTGLVYIPGTFAQTEEISELTKPVAEQHGIYVSHVRDEGAKGAAAINEAIAIGEQTGARVHISHFKVQGPSQWGAAQSRLNLIKAAQQRGQSVSLDQYPYNASSTGLAVLLPSWLSEGSLNAARQKLSNPGVRKQVRTEMLAQLRHNGWEDYSFAHVAYCQFDPSLVGQSIAEVTEKESAIAARTHHVVAKETVSTLSQQADTVIDLFTHGGAQMVFFDMSEADVETIIKDSSVMFGSDSSVRSEDGSSLPHPRGFGTFPRVLGVYARDKGLFSMEEAIRRMTWLPATTFGIQERGLIRANYWADLVIFDRHRISDRATYDDPLKAPDGVAYVLVNGSLVLDQGGLTTVTPGAVIRHGSV